MRRGFRSWACRAAALRLFRRIACSRFCPSEHGGRRRLRGRKEAFTERFEAPTVPPAATAGALTGVPDVYSVQDLQFTSYWECFCAHRRCLQHLGRFFLLFEDLRRN